MYQYCIWHVLCQYFRCIVNLSVTLTIRVRFPVTVDPDNLKFSVIDLSKWANVYIL